jgi:benzylsuccinate CoA-transferase BbsE subunit
MVAKKVDRPLDNLRVLDLTDEKGHLCGKFLADLGAEVIKIEPPEGDPVRQKGPFFHDVPDKEKSLPWYGCNSGKKGITLNLVNPKGQQIFKKLVNKADLIIESYSPGYLASLNLDFTKLQVVNPRVVLTSITPFGQTGPYANYVATDLTLVAMSGFMYTCGDANRPPVRIGIEQAFTAAGVQAASASLVALFHSQNCGQGEHVDIAIRECLPSGGFEVFFWETEGYLGERMGMRRRRANVYLRDLWPCKDGYIGWRLMTGHLGAPTLNNLIAWMDTEGMAGELKEIDWEKLDMTRVTQEQMARWESLVIPFFMKHTKAQIFEMALEKSMLMAPAYNARELFIYRQLIDRNFWSQVQYPELNATITHPGPFCKMSETPLEPPTRAPSIGEDNKTIYIDELKISELELTAMKKEGII